MVKHLHVAALLEAKSEPTAKYFAEAVKAVIRDPEQLSCLANEDVKGQILVHVTINGDRFSHFFDQLQLRSLDPPTSERIATVTSDLLSDIFQELHQLLSHEPKRLVRIVMPVLEVCLRSSNPKGLRRLALVFDSCNNFVKYLAADLSGSSIIQRWIDLPSSLALTPESQAAWTDDLVQMILSCQTSHKVEVAVKEWAKLKSLKSSLQVLEMDLLQQEDNKKTKTQQQQQQQQSSLAFLENGLEHLLVAFDLPRPKSRRMVQQHIETLSGQMTARILHSIVSGFPCKLCIPSAEAKSLDMDLEMPDESRQVVSDLQLDVFGKAIWDWKVVISEAALKSMKAISSDRLFNSVKESLDDIGSGNFRSRKQKENYKRLKVPLRCYECGHNVSILWQVFIGHDEITHGSKQMITIWAVGDSSAIDKGVLQATHFQRGYSEETVRRCRPLPSSGKGKEYIPIRFIDDHSDKSMIPSEDLDVRTVDPQVIAMGNKFYALTEPVIRSILANELTAEFPFDLSREEAQCIAHFQTSSLILGRSGTGKTTCLVFKLVGKYLARQAVLDERPARQVFLTRSSFLAEKIRPYTRRLIRALTSKSVDAMLPKQTLEYAMSAEKELDDESILTLEDDSFPLVCTFDHFLQLLENSVIALDRQNFSESLPIGQHDDSSSGRSYQPQLVDFYTFKVDYWPRLPHRKDIPAHLVFSEIMGVIKGSESSRASLEPLSREEYKLRSDRLAPTFGLDTERSHIYDLFEKYEVSKHHSGDYDYVDRVANLLKRVRQDQSLRQKLQAAFDEIYIDEIQDQRCIDIELFLSIIRDGRGFHFAGDTAQAISNESTFRFADVKKMIFDHFAHVSYNLGRPEMFLLSKNYRSHQGILSLAALVMGMIWQGYPETVDKLEPEIGSLHGPKPVLFCDCDEGILVSSNVGSAKMSEQAADFGAEQVILVRNPQSKKSLQDKIGDRALVLTVLESKGMEFDDVILWDIFSGCPNQAGVRSLSVLKNKPAAFDPKKHTDMCLELKSFYVAITRARTQLFIVETSRDTARTVQQLFADQPDHVSTGATIEVTGPNHKDFAVRVEMMRASKSTDLEGWQRRADGLMEDFLFKEALMAYRRAGNSHGETLAKGHLKKEEGRICRSKGDEEGFKRNLTVACEHFLQVGRIGEAIGVLIAQDKLEEAAEMWLKHGNLSKAATLFAQIGLYQKVFECHDKAKEHEKAASILQRLRQYDDLVAYVGSNTEKISPSNLHSYSLLCKLLLKQNKISDSNRQHAIKLLGSLKDQEACFVEYGMDRELEMLYTQQRNSNALFDLYSKTGKLDKALEIGLSKDLLQMDSDAIEDQLLRVLDSLWAGHWTQGTQDTFAVQFLRSSEIVLTEKIESRCAEWDAITLIHRSKGVEADGIYMDKTVTLARRFLDICVVRDQESIGQTTFLDDLPLEGLQRVVGFAKELIVKHDPSDWSVLLLSLGCWRPNNEWGENIILPWSRLIVQTTPTHISAIEARNLAKCFLFDNLACAILLVGWKARGLWNSKWPARCFYFLAKGSCRDQLKGECKRLHTKVGESTCVQIIEDLLRVNKFFCDLAFLYHRHMIDNETFSKNYLGIRRHWLERLLIELDFHSALEQSASTIARLRANLYSDERYKVIRSSIEELLYFRLGKEWQTRKSFTALLEQIQLSEMFGPHIQTRFFCALSNRLLADQNAFMLSHLILLNALLHDPSRLFASDFQSKLSGFLSELERHEVSEFSRLRSLTVVFERLATVLLIKTCTSSCLLTKSWVELYLPYNCGAAPLHSLSLSFEDKYKYQKCLAQLTKAFCDTLVRIDTMYKAKRDFLYSGNVRDLSSLMQRNGEMLAIILMNLGTMTSMSTLFREIRINVNKVLALEIVRAAHLNHNSGEELGRRLAAAFIKYNGKDNLVVIHNDQSKGSLFLSLQKHPGVEIASLAEICPPCKAPAATSTSAQASQTPTTPAIAQETKYTLEEINASKTIQRFWQLQSSRVKTHRAFMLLPETKLTERFFGLVTQSVGTLSNIERVPFRGLLTCDGVALSLRLEVTQAALQALQKDTMECIEKVEIAEGVDRAVDEIFSANKEAEDLVGTVTDMMSDHALIGLLTGRNFAHVAQHLMDVGNCLEKAELVMAESRKGIGKITQASQ